MVFSAIVGFFIVATIGGVGFGVAAADSTDDLARAGAFGFDAATNDATMTKGATATTAPAAESESFVERSTLAAASVRTIDSGLQMIDDREREKREHIAADNIAVIDRIAAGKAKQGFGSDPSGETVEYGLPGVDWTIGHDAFIAEWTARIDAYLDGSPLAGYGAVFAEAAWDNGVDPRWSPSISNTESGKGKVCFLPCNAWGWGASVWPDWNTAIRAHVAGLAEGYGYSITPEAAEMYCPPNHVNWYHDTYGQMGTI